MLSTSMFAETAALVGDPARANMLAALMDGRALTAKELADAAGITPQTASGHLAQLTQAGLLAMERRPAPVPPSSVRRSRAHAGKHYVRGGRPRRHQRSLSQSSDHNRTARKSVTRSANLLRSPCRPSRCRDRRSDGAARAD
jgi:DNA-binding transcriptional ArsR family regulator